MTLVEKKVEFLARLSHPLRWAFLLFSTIIFTCVLELTGLPAALLLGAMVAAILVETNGGALQVPRLPYYAAQAVIGCLIARAVTPVIIATFLKEWPVFLAVGLAVILASSLFGWCLGRFDVLPGTTAIWGLSPGAAPVMMLMAEAFGADARLVAFMQYLRVVFVAIVASVIARFVVHAHGAPTASVDWFPLIQWVPFTETLAVALIGSVIGHYSRLPAGNLLVPMIAGGVLHGAGLIEIQLPQWLLAACYIFLGWNIGMGFTRSILVHAARVLPQVTFSILSLILFCGGLAWILVVAVGVDPMTAYLATSPGGMDSVAIIAASTKVDVSFVMSLQTIRFALVLFVGPSISRFVASLLSKEKPKLEKTAPLDSDTEILVRVKENESDLD
jgi:membrane AbrB-like protein